MPVMRRNRPARHVNGFQGPAALEEKQHALSADVIGAEAFVPKHELPSAALDDLLGRRPA